VEHQLDVPERLRPPARLLQSHQYVIQALTLRVDGLRGMLDALRRQQGRSSRPQTAALLAAQGARLLTSDVLWQDLVQPAAAAQLKQAGITGVSVPVSVFVTHTELVSTNSLLLLLAGPRLASGPATATTLALGDTGPAVAAWQRELNRWLATHPPGKMAPDGSFGPTTQTATQALQRAQGLTPDGIVGKGTRQALAAVIAGTGGLATPGSG